MKKFKKGDSVQLKQGLTIGEEYGSLTLLPPMVFKGTRKVIRAESDDTVLLRCGGLTLWYTFDMIQKATS